jgi:hypothetical protein
MMLEARDDETKELGDTSPISTRAIIWLRNRRGRVATSSRASA